MFSISKESDYALNAVFYLVGKTEFVSISEISQELCISKRYLAKILSKLAGEKILESREGKFGGFKLANRLENIVLYDFLIIFENDLSVVKCCDDRHKCDCNGSCAHKDFFKEYLSGFIVRELKSRSLREIYNYKR